MKTFKVVYDFVAGKTSEPVEIVFYTLADAQRVFKDKQANSSCRKVTLLEIS